MTLADFVRKNVQPKTYYDSQFDDIRWSLGTEARVRCVFHSEKTPSLHLNEDTGSYYCHGCGASGRSIVKFHSDRYQLGHPDAAAEIFHKFVHPTIPSQRVSQWKKLLTKTPAILSYIRSRFVSDEVRDAVGLGYNGRRITFPIYDQFGQVVNAKLYDVNAKKNGSPKMVNYRDKAEKRSFGSPPRLFPLSSFGMARDKCNDRIVLCEGEWDALALISMGIAAVTGTHGVKAWNPDFNEYFRGLDVVIAFDNDKDGTKFWQRPLKAIRNIARAVYRFKIPKEAGKDITDWIRSSETMRHAEAWDAKFDRLKPQLENPDSAIDIEIHEAPLDQVVSDSSLISKDVRFKARIAGESMSPFIVPHKARVTCKKTCGTCPLVDTDKEFREVTIDPSDPNILEFINVSKQRCQSKLTGRAGMVDATPECGVQVEVVSHTYFQQLILNPAVGSGHRKHVTTTAFVPTETKTQPTREYIFEGKVLPDPTTQVAVIVAPKASLSVTDIEAFDLTPALHNKLKGLFSVSEGESVESKLEIVVDWQSRNITKIPNRQDLHLAVMMVFCSVSSLSLRGMRLKRGMLDVLVLGDSSTGKGSIAEGLLNYYQLGQVASGESSTYAGLVAAVESIGKQWMIRWGLIPMSNGRLVLIDEMSSMSTHDIGKLTRVRSEGIAESNKVRSDRAEALTRMIWLSNTRSGRLLSSYPFGVVAARELVGAVEDVRRFDFVLFIGDEEVDTESINTFKEFDTSDNDRFQPDDFRNLILWAWSRTEDQIEFSDMAIKKITEESIFLMEKYPPSDIPLVQGANVRFKLAKIACAVAAMVYSTDRSGEMLKVKAEHVVYSSKYLDGLYTKQSAGYDRYTAQSGIREPETLERELKELVPADSSLYVLLGAVNEVSPDTLANVTSGDSMLARRLLSTLVNHRAVSHVKGQLYSINPEFMNWLDKFETKRKNHALRNRK